MKEQFDIAARRKRLGLVQLDLAEELAINSLALGAIEDGRIGIDKETYDRIHAAIDRLEKRKEALKCQEAGKGATLTAA